MIGQKLQATAIINDSYKYVMDLTTNGLVVTDALRYVTQKAEQVNTLQKLDERIESIEGEGEETTNITTTTKTTNVVF